MPLWKRKWSIPNLQCPFISYVRDTALWTSPQSISHVKNAEKVSAKEVFSTNTSDSTTRKTSQTVLYVEEIFLLSSCWRATLQGLIQIWTQTHQDTKFECETCDNVHNRRDKLEKHKTTCGSNMVRVREAPTEEYKCDACEKIFTKNAYLSQHKRTHAVRMKLGEYDCKFCEKIYTSNQNLGKHMQLCIFFKKNRTSAPLPCKPWDGDVKTCVWGS